MSFKRYLLVSAGLFAVSLATNVASVCAEQWYFYVRNSSDAVMTNLLVSETGKKWGEFDIGDGIGSGEKAKLIWDSSTDNESCEQYIKAVFSDGTESTPTKFNFCKDLDTPIVFK
ncbi:MAG: hypothetical protein DCE90_19365 [Pseudanabaena sp.]|nr:MAG: hypothetical protein DCE90_19365 [Pseudanabaena sp.]